MDDDFVVSRHIGARAREGKPGTVPPRNNPRISVPKPVCQMNWRLTQVQQPLLASPSRRRSGRPRTLLLGSKLMKKIAFVVAAAGLMTLAACNKSPEAAAVENNGDMVADNMDATADNMSAMADNTSNAMASDQLDNAADNMHDAADNVRDNADAVADNMN
ncbi:MAG: hypothetical protein ACTHM8_08035 [Sphingomonas sp.]